MRKIFGFLRKEDHLSAPLNYKKIEGIKFGNSIENIRMQYFLT